MGVGNYYIPGLSIRGGGRSLPWANLPLGNAIAAFDFTTDQARWNNAYVGGHADIPGWSFTRASTGYAQNVAGLLIPFASGAMRRTDKGILVEGARTNLCTYSQGVDNAAWSKTNTLVSANALAAPDGTLTADKLTANNATGGYLASCAAFSATNATVYAGSIMIAPGELGFALVGFTGSAFTTTTVSVNLATGAVSAGTGTMLSSGSRALANGYVLVWFTLAATSTNTGSLTVYLSNDGVWANRNNAITTGSGVYLWGGQVEAAAFPSSYIPTTTTSATRAADVALVGSVTGLDYPLTLYAEFERAVDTGGTETVLQIDSGNINNRASLLVNTGDTARFAVTAASASQMEATVGSAIAVGAATKTALRVASNDGMAAKGGALGSQDTSLTLPSAPNTVRLATGDGAGHLFGYLKRAAIYPRALSDAELQSVTT